MKSDKKIIKILQVILYIQIGLIIIFGIRNTSIDSASYCKKHGHNQVDQYHNPISGEKYDGVIEDD